MTPRRWLASVLDLAATGLHHLAERLGGGPWKLAGQKARPGRMRNAPGGAGNTLRGLTRSLDLTKEELDMKPTRICTVEGCDRPHKARGWCALHYERWKRHGSLDTRIHSSPYDTMQDRLDRLIDREGEGGCWNWQGSLAQKGYGQFRRPAQNGEPAREVRAHRAVYEHYVGPIPDGMILDHKCHNRGCVNPQHLRVVTYKQNAENASKPRRSDNRSGYKSVHWSKQRQRWIVRVHHIGRPHFGGYFTDVHEAGEAARQLRNRLFTHNDIDRQEPA